MQLCQVSAPGSKAAAHAGSTARAPAMLSLPSAFLPKHCQKHKYGFSGGAAAATAGGCGRVLPAHMIACAFSHTMLCCLVASTSAPAYAPCSASTLNPRGKSSVDHAAELLSDKCLDGLRVAGASPASLDVDAGHFCPMLTSSERRRVSSSAQTIHNVLAALSTAAYACSSS